MFVAFFFLFAGIFSLISIISDNNSPPSRVPAVVTGYTTSIFDNSPHLSLRAQRNGGSSTITPAITPAERLVIHPGDMVTLDYSPHLRYLYALEDRGQRYALPGGNPLSGLVTAIVLIPLGLLFSLYPLLLTLWGWHDLRQPPLTIRGRVMGLRSSQQARAPQLRRATHPGLTPRIGRTWYGVALESLDSSSRNITTFAINEEQFRGVRKGQIAQVLYSPHLHHVLSIKPTENVE